MSTSGRSALPFLRRGRIALLYVIFISSSETPSVSLFYDAFQFFSRSAVNSTSNFVPRVAFLPPKRTADKLSPSNAEPSAGVQKQNRVHGSADRSTSLTARRELRSMREGKCLKDKHKNNFLACIQNKSVINLLSQVNSFRIH